ncbi:hypothetical protein [Roseovarius sp. ZX-A-9]|uniref:hypothetical protein n=1 Tax=Roseovarius sp. ZX-A-9 TaxID=3014783 RepID=UPI00232BD6B6|nr:hypothetical protein [Roseovarius sp. ZX-A-9]
MTRKDDPKKPGQTGNARADRLSRALKANLARRKAQSRAREGGKDTEAGQTEQDKG